MRVEHEVAGIPERRLDDRALALTQHHRVGVVRRRQRGAGSEHVEEHGVQVQAVDRIELGEIDEVDSYRPPDGEPVVIGLPDTVWFPDNALRALADDQFSFLLFPVERPELFDAVVTDSHGAVREIQVKQTTARSNWIWGAFKMPGATFASLYRLWSEERQYSDIYIGTLVNAYIGAGGSARAVYAGEAYFDVGTLTGYREAMRVLSQRPGGSLSTAREALK